MDVEMMNTVKVLLEKARTAANSLDAMHYTQAANNAAGALVTFTHVPKDGDKTTD